MYCNKRRKEVDFSHFLLRNRTGEDDWSQKLQKPPHTNVSRFLTPPNEINTLTHSKVMSFGLIEQ